MAGHKFKRTELVSILDACKGKSLGTLDTSNVFERARHKDKITGIAGDIVEQSILNYPSDTEQKPDLCVDGQYIELKTTGLERTTRAPYYAAKERVTITAVSPKNIVKEQFENSHFWQKTEHLLFVYYFYDATKSVKAIDYSAFIFQGYQFFSFEGNDLAQIKTEWQRIKSIYTRYLTDYKSTEARNQLRGLDYLEVVNKKGSPRIAISRKYVNVIVRKNFGEHFEPILKEQMNTDIETTILDIFKPYIGKSRKQLCKKFNVVIPKKNPKAVNPTLVRRMLNLEADIQDSEEFQKASIAVKTLTVKRLKKGLAKRTKESLKIQNFFNFKELVNEKWNKSELRKYLHDTKFFLIVFEKLPNGDQVFRGVKFWQVSLQDLDGPIKLAWKETQHILNTGVNLEYIPMKNKKGYRVENDFPKVTDRKILHVRPDAGESSYKSGNKNTLPLPSKSHWINRPDNLRRDLSDSCMTRQAFWLNNDYMFQQIKDLFAEDNV